MTNRQARREQRRSQRNRGGQRPRPGGQRPAGPPGGGGGPGSFFSLPYLIGVGVLVVILGGVIAFLAMRDSDSEFASMIVEAEASFPHELAEGRSVGDADAPISLVSFIDFRCPFCMRFAAEDEPQLIDEYVRDGLLRIETRHMPVLPGDGSVIAAEAAQCALRQDGFWDMQHRLFLAHARDGTGTSVFSSDAVKGYARDIGLDGAQFDECMDSRATNDEVQDDRAESQSYGFTGTPSFLINGQPLSGAPANIDGWRTIIDGILEDLDGDTPPANGDTEPDDSAEGDSGEEETTE
jgi:protein-disulfide isomerase